MPNFKNLDLKIQILQEYLENGGVNKIPDPLLIQDIIDVKKDHFGNVIPESVTSRLNTFMMILLQSRCSPPFFDLNSISEYEHILQKRNFFSIDQVDTESEFDILYESLKDVTGYLFRGQSEAKWRLYSSLQRSWLSSELPNNEIEYKAFLQDMIDRGSRVYSNEIEEILGMSNEDTINDLSVMGFLQHHGCPTPLLDWTYNFRVALFFAIDRINTNPSKKEIENYFSVYHIEEEHFEGGNVRNIIAGSLERISLLEKERILKILCGQDMVKYQQMKAVFESRSIFDPARYYGSGLIKHLTKLTHMLDTGYGYYSDRDLSSGIIFSMSNNQNIKNQDGVFTFDASPSLPLEMQAYEYSKEDYNSEDNKNYYFCDCININKSLVPYIREKLNNDGITNSLIYPSKNDKAKYIYEGQLTIYTRD